MNAEANEGFRARKQNYVVCTISEHLVLVPGPVSLPLCYENSTRSPLRTAQRDTRLRRELRVTVSSYTYGVRSASRPNAGDQLDGATGPNSKIRDRSATRTVLARCTTVADFGNSSPLEPQLICMFCSSPHTLSLQRCCEAIAIHLAMAALPSTELHG